MLLVEAATTTAVSSVRAAGSTHTGRRRKLNEDYLLMRPALGIFAVLDGVGGRNAGEVASSLAAVSVANFFEATQHGGSWPAAYRALLDLTLAVPAQRLSAALRKANHDVYEMAQRRAHKKMSSTAVAAHVPSGSTTLHIGHVGDSRCYRIRGSSIDRLTRDHTLRNEAILKHPEITEDRLARIPENVITRALGAKENVEIDLQSIDALPGDRYLLCSDGVNRMLSDEQIREAVAIAETPKEGCDLLVELSNEAGGRDNITALIISFKRR